MGERETFHVSAAMQCSIYYHIYLIKRRPRSRAAYASKIKNKRPLPRTNATPSRHLRFYLSKMRDTWEPLKYIILTNNLQ